MAGLRACLAVRKNKAGYCQCSRYGTPEMAKKSFLELCQEASLPVKVGKVIPKKHKGGKKMRLARLEDFNEYDDVEEIKSISDFLGKIDWNFVKEFGYVNVGSAIAGAGYQLVDNKVLAGKIENDYLKAGLKAGVGLLGAYLLRKVNRPIAYGVAGALVGGSLMDLVNKFMSTSASADASAEKAEQTAAKGLFETIPSEEELYTLSEGEEESEAESIVPTEGVEEEKLLLGDVEEEKLLTDVEEEKVFLGDDESSEEEALMPITF